MLKSITLANYDYSFNANHLAGGTSAALITALAIQPDGKVIVSGSYTGDQSTNRTARLNPDGTLDTTFNVGSGFAFPTQMRTLALQPDGKILLGGRFSSFNGIARNGIVRLNSGGALDTTFSPGSGISGGSMPEVRALAVQTDGKVVAGGDFQTYNAIARPWLARVQGGNGACSYALTPANQSFGVNGGSGSIAVAAPASCPWVVTASAQWVTLTGNDQGSGNGTVTFDVEANTGPERVATITIADQTFIVTQQTAPVPGLLDTAFLPNLTGPNDVVTAVARQPDGKILIGGNFTAFNQVSRIRIARLNADGSLDESFNPGTGFAGLGVGGNGRLRIATIVVKTDGKILVGGDFSSYNDETHNSIVQLNSDGSRDQSFSGTGFTGSPGLVNAISLQSNGKILVGGFFNAYNGAGIAPHLARLNSDGTIDTAFNIGSGLQNQVQTIALQTDGKIVIGGDFLNVNGVSRIRCARLNDTGGLDMSFDPGGRFPQTVRVLLLQPNGKIIAASSGNATAQFLRLNEDGGLDTSFTAGIGFMQGNNAADVFGVALQPDGRILATGNFTTYNTINRNGLARLTSTGTLDTTFDIGAGLTLTNGNSVASGNSLVLQPDGKVVVGGLFHLYNGTPKPYLARVFGTACLYALTPGNQNFPTLGGSGSFAIATTSQCGWTATSSVPWITVTGNPNGTGNGNVSFSVAPNTDAARTGTISVGGSLFTVTQDSGCAYSINPTIANVVAAGGNGFVSVTAGVGCAWTAQVVVPAAATGRSLIASASIPARSAAAL